MPTPAIKGNFRIKIETIINVVGKYMFNDNQKRQTIQNW
jgi:hypothetical protein